MSALGLLAVAMKNAIEDAGLGNRDVDGIISRGPDDVYCHHQRMGQILGIDASFSTTLDNGGASQCLGVALAVMAIHAGLCHTVVVGYGRDSWSRTRARRASNPGAASAVVPKATDPGVHLVPVEQQMAEFRPEFGYFGEVATHAFAARRHMHLYGTTKEQLGRVAITFRQHASRNPLAQRREPLTMEEYLNGRKIVEPFNVFDCSLLTDGAGAVVVTTAERAKDLRHPPVYVRGFGTANNLTGWFEDEHMTTTAAKRSGEAAYRMAGLGPEDIDAVQLYDCFTYMVIVQLEDYGFCKKGEGGPFVESGALRLDGRLPANTSGGQLSEGHVEGMLQIVETVHQLRHDRTPERQVPDVETILVSGHGGNTVCHSTLILRR